MNTARTWKCPQCGQTEEITYNWLAEHGGPVCDKCDYDMELRAEAADDRAVVVERLADKADAAGLQGEDFDEMVHEFAASIAADVNNGGVEEQIAYLVDGLGTKYTERQLDELIERKQREGE